MNHYQFHVSMSCSGCSGAVERVLRKLDGVDEVVISLEDQSVDVLAFATYESVYSAIEKSGKKINSGVTIEETLAL